MTAGTAAEAARRIVSRWSGRLRSLPILALSVHSACNCRCVMCDIWRANAASREIPPEDLDRHAGAIRRLRVRRVMLTGGEPLLHRNLWALCDRLRAEGIRLSLVTTGLLLDRHAADIARAIDELVVSIDGPPDVHDAIRRVPGGFARIARGIQAVRAVGRTPFITVRTVVQRANHTVLADIVDAASDLGVERLSFLGADVSSPAFNRPTPWSASRQAEIAVGRTELPALAAAIRTVESRCAAALHREFVAGGIASLWRLHAYYQALAGDGAFPNVRCNAPWVSAVLEPGGILRPCFFHAPYAATADQGLDAALNSAQAIQFRRDLRVGADATCRRCVCSLTLPAWRPA